MVESRRRRSLLGVIALLAGVAALVLTRFNPTGVTTVPVGPIRLALPVAVAVGALAVALLAFVAAATSPRTGTALPIFAVLVGAGAAVVGYYPGLFTHAPSPTVAPAAPAPPAPTVENTPAETPPAEADSRPRQKTIFDMDGASSTLPPPAKNAPPRDEPPPLPEAAPAPARIDHAAAIRDAKARVDAARESAVRSAEASPAYQSAKEEADAADAELKSARLKYEPGSPELIAASQAALNAHSKLQRIVSDAMARDPEANDALRALQAAQTAPK